MQTTSDLRFENKLHKWIKAIKAKQTHAVLRIVFMSILVQVVVVVRS